MRIVKRMQMKREPMHSYFILSGTMFMLNFMWLEQRVKLAMLAYLMQFCKKFLQNDIDKFPNYYAFIQKVDLKNGTIWAVYKNWEAVWTAQDFEKCEAEGSLASAVSGVYGVKTATSLFYWPPLQELKHEMEGQGLFLFAFLCIYKLHLHY
ncbi:hypothetical protein ACJX0J_033110 [Zea mays]